MVCSCHRVIWSRDPACGIPFIVSNLHANQHQVTQLLHCIDLGRLHLRSIRAVFILWFKYNTKSQCNVNWQRTASIMQSILLLTNYHYPLLSFHYCLLFVQLPQITWSSKGLPQQHFLPQDTLGCTSPTYNISTDFGADVFATQLPFLTPNQSKALIVDS